MTRLNAAQRGPLRHIRNPADQPDKDWSMMAAARPLQEDGDYDVPHSAITYLVAPKGGLAVRFVDAPDAETLAHRLIALLQTG